MNANATASAEPLVGRCYTKARRHQNVVGRWPGGGRIPGGPYTWPQIVVAVAALGLLVVTRGVWAHHGLVDLVPLVGVPGALALTVRRISVDGRNPFALAAGAVGLAVKGGCGRMDGRPVRTGRGGALVGVCTVSWPATHAPAAQPGAIPRRVPLSSTADGAALRPDRQPDVPTAPGEADTGVRVMSGVGALLAVRSRAANNESNGWE